MAFQLTQLVPPHHDTLAILAPPMPSNPPTALDVCNGAQYAREVLDEYSQDKGIPPPDVVAETILYHIGVATCFDIGRQPVPAPAPAGAVAAPAAPAAGGLVIPLGGPVVAVLMNSLNQITAKLTQIQNTQDAMRTTQNEMRTTQASMRRDLTAVETTQGTMQGNLAAIDTTQTNMQGNLAAIDTTQTNMQGTLTNVQATLDGHSTQLGLLSRVCLQGLNRHRGPGTSTAFSIVPFLDDSLPNVPIPPGGALPARAALPAILNVHAIRDMGGPNLRLYIRGYYGDNHHVPRALHDRRRVLVAEAVGCTVKI